MNLIWKNLSLTIVFCVQFLCCDKQTKFSVNCNGFNDHDGFWWISFNIKKNRKTIYHYSNNMYSILYCLRIQSSHYLSIPKIFSFRNKANVTFSYEDSNTQICNFICISVPFEIFISILKIFQPSYPHRLLGKSEYPYVQFSYIDQSYSRSDPLYITEISSSTLWIYKEYFLNE